MIHIINSYKIIGVGPLVMTTCNSYLSGVNPIPRFIPYFVFTFLLRQTGVIWEIDVTTKPHKQMNSKSLRHFYFVICQMLVRENKHVTPQQKILVSVC